MVDEYQIIMQLVSNIGFPIAITVYLLHRFEKKIDSLEENIQKLSFAIEKTQQKK